MTLADLLNALARHAVEYHVRGGTNVRICDLTEDSRTVLPGSLFVARAGLKADGKVFALDAAHAGAAAILTDDPSLHAPAGVPVVFAPDTPRAVAHIAEAFYGSPSSRIALAGVTGTNGKTTTSFLIWRMLNAAGLRCGLVGTVLVDDGRELARAAMTTPPAIELSRTLAAMAEGACTHAALEVSSHSLDQKRCDALAWKVGIFTNLSGDHLDYHGTMEAYAAAKARLFALLPPDATAVVNAMDPAAESMVRGTRARVLRCAGDARPADCSVGITSRTLQATGLTLRGPWGTISRDVPLIGDYNAMNVLQATAACHALGLAAPALGEALAHVEAPPGRLERVSDASSPFAVFVDYAHSDDSLRCVLRCVGDLIPGRDHAGARLADAAGSPREAPGGPRLCVVFGCGGDRDRTKRPRMGRAAIDLADAVIVTSDNPRTEPPAAIIDAILAGIPPELRCRVAVEPDRARAIRLAIAQARPGDAVVIAGKGHETEQVLPDTRGGTYSTHFDDREVARAALAERRPLAREVKPRRPARTAGRAAQPRAPRGPAGDRP